MVRSHSRLSRDVAAYVDGELDAGRAAAVGAHVATCWACSVDAELHRLVRGSLRRRPRRRLTPLAARRLRRLATSPELKERSR